MPGKVLVTGGAGFIGRTLVRMLVEQGYDVTALDNYRFSTAKSVPRNLGKRFTFVRGDCCQWNVVHKLVRGKHAVIHLAAPSSFLMYEEDALQSTVGTIHAFLNIVEAMRIHRVKKLVYASTSAVYEGNPVPYGEAMPLDPPDLKALSKKFTEEVARQYSDRYGLNCIGLRPFSVYGVGEDTKGGYANVISLFAWAMLGGKTPVIWGDGSQTRDFIYVTDVARAFITALEANVPTDEFNVGTGLETSFNGVVQIINKLLGTNLQPKYIPVPIAIYARRLWADTKKAKQGLGFEPEINVATGIEHVLQHAKSLLGKNRDYATKQMYFKTLPKPR